MSNSTSCAKIEWATYPLFNEHATDLMIGKRIKASIRRFSPPGEETYYAVVVKGEMYPVESPEEGKQLIQTMLDTGVLYD